MEKLLDIGKNVAIVILALIVAFIVFIGLGKLATYAFSSLASAGASLTSIFVPATSTPAVVGPVTTTTTSNATTTYSTSPAGSNLTSQSTPGPAPTTSAPATTYYTPRVSYYGLPDLSISLLSTGILDANGIFEAQPVVYQGQRAAVQVIVTNVGTNVSGPWILQAPLPTNTPGEVFTSYPQQSLAPGDSSKLTLSFDDLIDQNTSSMVITVDPYDQIDESNRSNNQVTVTFNQELPSINPTTYCNNTNGNGVYYSNGSYYTSPCTTSTYPYTTTYPYQGTTATLPELTPDIVSVGTINSYNGEYTASNYIAPGSQVGLQVQITNSGGEATGNFTFTANISGTSQEYTSPLEPSLAPGQTATYTVAFTSAPLMGDNTATVTVNPFNTIAESNYNNNTSSISFQVY